MSAPQRPQARPAELPLAGGGEGASMSVRPLLCATMRAPLGWFHRAEGRTAALKAFGIGAPREAQMEVPIVAFLLEHPQAGLVLVDTGFAACVAAAGGGERARNLGPVGRLMTRQLSMRPEQAVAAQLRALGAEPKDVGTVVMTHLHFDHASALCDFPAARVLVAQAEWRAGLARNGALHGYSRGQLDPRPQYRTLDFSAPPAQPWGAFAQTLDVFGDGSLRLAYTPGHSVGHLSLVVRLQEREALLTGDAAYTMQTLREGERPWRCEQPERFERSLAQLAAYDRANPHALVVPGHDMRAWEGLAELYS